MRKRILRLYTCDTRWTCKNCRVGFRRRGWGIRILWKKKIFHTLFSNSCSRIFFVYNATQLFDNFLYFIKLGDFANHPIHLHGYTFRVVATQKLQGKVTVERVKQMDRDGKIHRRLDRAPLKDTIKVPGGGFTIIRFYSHNPGTHSFLIIHPWIYDDSFQRL